MRQVKRLGPLSSVLEMVPGGGELLKQVSPEDLDRQLKQVEAIINSMTPQERRRPKVLNASRRKRIAAGSGTSVQEINQFIKQFQNAQRMMERLTKQGLPANIRGRFQ